MYPTIGVVAAALFAIIVAAPSAAEVEGSFMESRISDSPLHNAVWERVTERVTQLLAEGEDPNKPDANSLTALSLAAQGSEQIVALLLAAGADPNGRASSGMTPLMVAAQFGREAIAAALLAAGADVNAQDSRGRTALMYGAAERSTQVVSTLLRAGADPNIRAADGRTALSDGKTRKRDFHFGRWMIIWGSKVGDDDELVRLLREAGAK